LARRALDPAGESDGGVLAGEKQRELPTASGRGASELTASLPRRTMKVVRQGA